MPTRVFLFENVYKERQDFEGASIVNIVTKQCNFLEKGEAGGGG